MNISSMRIADRWLGLPLCAGMSIARLLDSVVRRRRVSALPRRILFIKLAEQGSTVLAHGAVLDAIRRVGRDNVFFLCFEENRFIVDVMALVPPEQVLTIRSSSIVELIVDSLRAVRATRRQRIDTTIDLEFFACSSALFAIMTGATHRVGLHAFGGEGPYRGNLLTHRVRYNPHLHTAQMFRVLVEALDVDPAVLPTFPRTAPQTDEQLPQFQPNEYELAAMRRKIFAPATEHHIPAPRTVQTNADGEPRLPAPRLVLLNPNCSDLLPLRAWPAPRYAELARRILATFDDVRVVLTGAPSEAEAAIELIKQIDSQRCVNLAGRTSLRELLVLYCIADALVTNDSGPAHFAALTEIDVITLFGPETPALFAARTPRNHVLRADLACSPCVSALNNRSSHCKDNLCMQQITVDRVFEELCHVLMQRERRRSRDIVLPTIQVLPAATDTIVGSRSARALTSQ